MPLWVPGLLALLLAEPQSDFRGREILTPDADEWQPLVEDVGPGPLREARRLLAEGDPKAARGLVEDWLADNRDDPDYYAAVLLLGDTYFRADRFWKASEQYDLVIENTVGDLFNQALRRQMDVARAFLSGKKRTVLGFLRISAYDEAIEMLDRIYERVPGSPIGEQAIKLKADYFFDRGEYELALGEYTLLAREYPDGRWARLALLRAATAAKAMFPGVRFDDQPLIEAAERFRQLQERFPDYAARENIPQELETIRQQQAAKDLAVGDYYRRAGQPPAAAYYFRQILQDWPGTPAAQQARARLRDLGLPPQPAE